jgi:hypothetical protein
MQNKIVKTITYSESRSLIKSGDIVFIKKTNHHSLLSSLISKVITFFTGGKYYHVGIAMWMSSDNGTKRLFFVDANTGSRRIVPLSEYEGYGMTVIESPVYPEYYEDELLKKVGKIQYGYLDAMIIGLFERFEITNKHLDFSGECCSEMITKMLNKGINHDKLPIMVSPNKLIQILIDRGHKIKFDIQGD